ncbi:sugar phosphate nucleotidyltransferase [Amylibacter sp.]|nr:sugar phosphate nucleotidyltransferase [Amylibacter sp.]
MHTVLCPDRVVGNNTFALLIADDFLICDGHGIVTYLIHFFEASSKTHFSAMEINGLDISKYGVVMPNGIPSFVAGLIEKPDANNLPSNISSIGRYVLASDIFNIIRIQKVGADGEIQLADTINS